MKREQLKGNKLKGNEMKRDVFVRRVAVALALLVTLGCVAGCSDHMEETGGVLKTENGKISFYHASTVYEAVEVGKKIGTLTEIKITVDVYAIEGQSTDEWRVTEDGYVLYAEGVQLPTLADMAPTSLEVCTQSSGKRIRLITDETVIADAVKAYTEGGSEADYALAPLEPLHTYQVRFLSETYDFLRYTVTYIEYSEDVVQDEINYGRYFLRSAFDGTFIPIGDGLHILLFGADATETETETETTSATVTETEA